MNFFPNAQDALAAPPSSAPLLFVDTEFVFSDEEDGTYGIRHINGGGPIEIDNNTVYTHSRMGKNISFSPVFGNMDKNEYVPACAVTNVHSNNPEATIYVTARCYYDEQQRIHPSDSLHTITGHAELISGVYFLPSYNTWIRCSDLLSIRI